MSNFLVQSIGVIGMAIVLGNLYLLETGRERAKSKMYLFYGFLGSLILVYYSFLTNSPLFVVLNAVFVVVNAYWLAKIYSRKTKIRGKNRSKH